MMKVFVALELAAAYPHEGDPVTVFRIQVGVDFKNESAELLFIGTNFSCCRWTALGNGIDSDKSVEHFPDAEIVDGASKKNRSDFSFEVFIHVQLTMNAIYQF